MKQKNFYNCIKLLSPYLFNSKSRFFATLITIFIICAGSASTVLLPKVSGNLFLSIQEKNKSTVILSILAIALLWIVESSYINAASVTLFKATNYAIKDLRLRVLLQLDKISLKNSSRYSHSEIIYCNERVPSAVVGFVNSLILTLLPALINVISIGLIFYLQYQYGKLLLATVCFIFIPAFYLLKKYSLSRIYVWKKGDHLRTVQNEFLLNKDSSNVPLLSWKERLEKFFDDEADAWDYNNKLFFILPILIDALQYIFFFFFAISFIFSQWSADNQEYKIVETIGLLVVFGKNFTNLTSNLRLMSSSSIDLDKVYEILSLPNEPNLHNLTVKDYFENIYEIKNLNLTRNGSHILQNANLVVKKKSKIAITGKSGAGKSSLCKILAGKDCDFEGDVKFFGSDIKKISKESIKSNVAYLTQEAILMNATVEDNLKMGQAYTPKSIVDYFAKRGMLNKQISEFGRNLSNGERQRILIGSIISLKPEILIIDEAFNSLDDDSAIELLDICLENIETVICITHQSFLLSKFSKVILIENSQVKEFKQNEI